MSEGATPQEHSQKYSLRWNNHRSNMLTVFGDLLQTEAFTDVSLVADSGRIIKCHKIVLAACSSYFQTLFIALPCPHPTIILKDVKYTELRAILEFIYRGEVTVQQEQLSNLLKIAEMLQVKGLVEHNGSDNVGERFSAYSDFRRHEDMMETSLSPPPAISTSTNANSMAAHSSSHVSPPHSTGDTYSSFYSKPLGTTSEMSQIQSHLAFWPLSLPLHQGVSTGHQISPHSSPVASVLCAGGGGGGSSHDNSFETTSPLKLVKKTLHSNLLNHDTPILRTVLGQGHVDSSVTGVPLLQPDSHESMHFRASNGSANDNDNRRSNTDLAHSEAAHSSYMDVPSMDEDEKQPSPQSHTGDKTSNATHVQAKPEWKRYKQYTRDDIQAAIQAVKSGISAVQAARQFGVPSRTLYDKVKKLGIPTSRPFKRSVSNGGSAARFPYGIGGNVNGRIYGGSILSENENENSMNVNIENLATSTSSASSLVAAYVKPASKDASQDRDSMSDSMARYSPSPVIRCAKQKQQQQNMDDEVEDLSVSRKSDVPVIMLTSSDAVKDEPQETGPNNNDCCDYS